MKNRFGFTIVELMVVILIVGILAAVAVPIMKGQIDKAKWSEGKAFMGTISRALRAHISEQGENFTAVPTIQQLGFAPNDLVGNYFRGGESGTGNFSWIINNDNPINFLVTATASAGINSPSQITLDHTGTFIEIP